MRTPASIALLLAVGGCTWVSTPPPGRLTLTNLNYPGARVQVAVTAAPECGDSGAVVSEVDLPLNGTQIVEAAPGSDVCWRRTVAGSGSGWTDWRRSFTATGRSIDSRL